MTELIKRQDIVDAARRYVGVPFKKGGRDARGMDCIGLLLLVGWELGIPLADTRKYTMNPEVELMKEFVYGQSVRRPISPVVNGSIAIFKQSVFPMHTGIMTRDRGQMMVINANLKLRAVVEQPFADWKSELIEFRDYEGVE